MACHTTQSLLSRGKSCRVHVVTSGECPLHPQDGLASHPPCLPPGLPVAHNTGGLHCIGPLPFPCLLTFCLFATTRSLTSFLHLVKSLLLLTSISYILHLTCHSPGPLLTPYNMAETPREETRYSWRHRSNGHNHEQSGVANTQAHGEKDGHYSHVAGRGNIIYVI